jgi:uncharacterized YccA/Bax inhibitor family protein
MDNPMTMQGTVHKTALLLVLTVTAAAWSWNSVQLVNPTLAIGLMAAALVSALVLIFKKDWAPVLAPVYAVCEGALLGVVSVLMERMYGGIVFQAVSLTFGTMTGLLVAYQSGWIRVTQNFRMGVFAATAGIGLVYLAGFVMSFFGKTIPLIHESGPVGIGFSLLVVGVAALNLVLDFDFIERAVESRQPKYMEWYAGFGLLVTLIWLYLEILRLLAKLQRRK